MEPLLTADVNAFQPAATGPAPAASQAVARVLEYAPGQRIALPPHTTLEIVEQPAYTPVPGAASYAYGLMHWQAQWLPLIDLASVLLPTQAQRPQVLPRYVLIVAYQSAPRQPLRHGAIALFALPEFVIVDNNAACPLPTDNTRWPELSLACFAYQDFPVPILDTARLFTRFHPLLPL